MHLGEYFPTHKELGFSGKVTSFLVKNILEVIGNRGLEIWLSEPMCSGFHIWGSRANRILSDSCKFPQGDEDSKVPKAQ